MLMFCWLVIIASASAQSQPVHDHDGNGSIDALDLFHAASNWQSDQGGSFGPAELLDFSGAWHTASGPSPTPSPTLSASLTPTPTLAQATPTPSATGTGTRTLSLPENFPVPLVEVVPGSGLFNATINVPVYLSDTNGVSTIEVTLPGASYDSLFQYTASIQTATTTALTSGFQKPVITGSLNKTIRITSTTPLGSGAGDVLLIRILILPLASPPPPNAHIPLTFVGSSLLNNSSGPITHTRANGSLLVNPDANVTPLPTATRTPTPTQFVLFTPTPTTPAGTAVGLKLFACVTRDYRGAQLPVRVYLVDAAGRNVNPGVAGGAAPIDVNFSATGAARFYNAQQKYTEKLDKPGGLLVQVNCPLAETVIISATASGLQAATPIALELIRGGAIRGTVTIQGQPAGMDKVRVDVIDANTGAFVTSANPQVSTGDYFTRVIGAGTYDVSFVSVISASPLLGECVKGVTVVENQITANINADLEPLNGGVRVYGQVTAKDGSNVLSAALLLYAANQSYCGGNQAQLIFNFGITGVPALDYEFKNVQAGIYNMYGGGASTNPLAGGLYLPSTGVPVVVGNSDLQFNVEMTPITTSNMLSPVGYSRAASPLTFQWSNPATGSGFQYEVHLIGPCGLLWSKSGITGTSAVYDGPALDRRDVYSWNLIGETPDGSLRVAGTGFQQPIFVLE